MSMLLYIIILYHDIVIVPLSLSSARMCMAFNPLVVSFGEHLERSMGKKLSMVQLAMQHSSAQYNMVAGLDEDVLLPMEELMAQARKAVLSVIYFNSCII